MILYRWIENWKAGEFVDSIKNMLLGIAILLVTIIVHLSFCQWYITDFIAIVGVILVIVGYYSKD